MEIISEEKPFHTFEPCQEISVSLSKKSLKCLRRSTSQQYFCEVYQLATITPRIRNKITQQIRSQSEVIVPNLTGLQRCFLNEEEGCNKLTILSSFATPSIKSLISEKKDLPEGNDLFEVMLQIAKVVSLLHQRKATHGNIQLQNVFYSQADRKVTVGRPRLRQLDKHLRNWPWDNSLCTPPELSKGLVPSFVSDIWQLGSLFLQMALKEDLEGMAISSSKDVLQMIGRVQEEGLCSLLKRMLTFGMPIRLTAEEVVSELTLIKQREGKSHQKSQVQISPQKKYQSVRINVFDETALTVLKQTQITDQQFAGKSSTFFCRFYKKPSLAILQHLKKAIQKITIQITFPQNFYQRFFDMIRNYPEGAPILIKNDGTCVMAVATSTNQLSIRSNLIFLSGNMGNIIHESNREPTSALMLTEKLALSVITHLYNQATQRQKTKLSYQNQLIKSFEIQKCYFPLAYKIDKLDLHNRYCLVNITTLIAGSCFYFKTLIKNYKEQIIHKQAIASGVFYNYQIGYLTYRRGEIEFHPNTHTFKAINYYNIPLGEPLTINFSNNTFAIIGLYMGEGRGITFDGKFQERVYQWMADCEKVQVTGMVDLTFAIIQCANFRIENVQILCLSNQVNRIQLLNIAEARKKVQQLLKNGRKNQQLAKLLFDNRFDLFLRGQYKIAKENCRKSQQIVEKIYKLPVCIIAINFNLANELVQFELKDKNGNLSREVRKQCYDLLNKCIILLQKHRLSPLLLARAYIRAAIFLNEAPRSLELHNKCSIICHQLRHRALLSENIRHTIRDYELSNQRIQQLCLQYEKILLESPLGSSPMDRLQHLKIKMDLLRTPKRYALVNICIQQLFQIANSYFQDDDLKQMQLKQIWKPFLVELMGNNEVQLKILLDLQQILKKYDEDSHIHLQDTFRKKEAMIKQRENLKLSLFQMLSMNQY